MLSLGDPSFGSRRHRTYAIAVYEVEAFRFDPGKQLAASRRLNRVPSHMGQPFGVQALHQPWPDAAACCTYTMFDATFEKHLVTHANGQRRAPGRQAAVNELWSANSNQARHACGKRTHARDNQTIGRRREPRVTGNCDLCASTRNRPFRRADVA